MVSPSDFTGIPFVAGSIIGERCWKVSDTGLLVSPSYPYGWQAKENVSMCNIDHRQPVPYEDIVKFVETFLFKDKEVLGIELVPAGNPKRLTFRWRDRSVQNEIFYMDPTWSRTTEGDETPPEPRSLRVYSEGYYTIDWAELYAAMRPEQPQHHFAKCTCGFYAYLNGANEYIEAGRVIGVVEGYGETLIGKRGFRTQKARVLALAACPVSSNVVVSAGGTGAAVPTISGSFAYVTWNDDYTHYPGSNYTEQPINPPPLSEKNKTNVSGVFPITTSEIDWDKVLANYPDAVYFDDVEVMRAEFPATDISEWIEEEKAK